jgi:hypothetical protein
MRSCRRVDDGEFRPGWLVRTRVVSLVAAGQIGRAELEAAIAWGRWCVAIGRIKGQRWDLPIDRGRSPGAEVTEQQLAAANRLRAAAEALGADRAGLLMWVIIDDLPWEKLAAKIGLSARTVKARVAETLSALTAWCACMPIPPAPKNRLRIQPSGW